MSRGTMLPRAAARAACFLPALVAGGQTCDPHWSSRFPGSDLDESVHAFVMFDDDGGGPNPEALYVAGAFTTAGGASANRIARWDGSSWSALGAGANKTVHALAVFDDDGDAPNLPALYAAGEFSQAGGAPASRIARWNGSSWSALGAGLGVANFHAGHALRAFDDDGAGPTAPALYVGGLFTTAGGQPASNIARWDGTSWTVPGGGVAGGVQALAVHDEDGAGPGALALFATGSFTTAGGNTALRIARWDGASWSALGSGLSDFAFALAVHDEDGAGPGEPVLFVGGGFQSAGGVNSLGVARWNGAAWSAAGGISQVLSLGVFDEDGPGPDPPALFAGGNFFIGGGNFIARRDGGSWTPLGGGTDNWVWSLGAFDIDGPGGSTDALVAGGDFISAGAADATHIAGWDGSSWSAFSPPQGLNNSVSAIIEYDPDDAGPEGTVIVAAGSFTSISGQPMLRVAQWDGTSWSDLGGGFGFGSFTEVRALAVFDEDDVGPLPPRLFAGGQFLEAGGEPISYLARWDGVSWSEVGGGVNSSVQALVVHDQDGPGALVPALYATGSFTTAGGSPANRIARWNGTAWSALASGLNGQGEALVSWDRDGPGPVPPGLVAGGQFSSAGGVTATHIAQWNGVGWSALGLGTNEHVYALCTFDADGSGPGAPLLVAGGFFGVAGIQVVNGIATWNGVAWSALATGMNNIVRAVASFDADGPGPEAAALYAGGDFTTSSGVTTNYVAKWNGSAWSALDGGANAVLRALRAVDDPASPIARGLFAGGFFTSAGGVSSTYLGAWVGCYTGDVDGDGTVGIVDFLSLLAAWGTCPAPCPADFDRDGSVGITDFLALLGNWS